MEPLRKKRRVEPCVFSHNSLRSVLSLKIASDMQEKADYVQSFNFDPLTRVMQHSMPLESRHLVCFCSLELSSGEVPSVDTLRRLIELDKRFHFYIPSMAEGNQASTYKVGDASAVAYMSALRAEDKPREDAELFDLEKIFIPDLGELAARNEKKREDPEAVAACDSLWAKEEALFHSKPKKIFPKFQPLF
eukprot:GEMP01074850.1.p1 GENE.GEMP01074850.1~~GEMP01074850.1.p1  ORF type:complete len:191 (+),score=35.07 GEMP01074850.1:109-681(+)